MPSPLGFWGRLEQLFLAPANGLYGVKSSSGFIGPDESGDLFGAAAVFFFVIYSAYALGTWLALFAGRVATS